MKHHNEEMVVFHHLGRTQKAFLSGFLHLFELRLAPRNHGCALSDECRIESESLTSSRKKCIVVIANNCK